MGYIRHKAIVVTSYDETLIKEARNEALTIIDNVEISEVVKSGTNGYHSFFIAPDGSKEGWSSSDEGDESREEFIRWIDDQAYEDESNCLSYVYVFYGDDERESEIIKHN